MNLDFLNSNIHGYSPDDLSSSDCEYIEKYWIESPDLKNSWGILLDAAFKRSPSSVSIQFGRTVDIKRGGLIFDEPEFHVFSDLAKKTGAIKFAVVEDVEQSDWDIINDNSFFRFSYPVDISWNEMVRSCPLADDVFLRPIRCFFVILDNGAIGKYVNNDAETPYELTFTH